MVYLFIGMVIGGTAGLFTGCLLVSAKEADKEIVKRHVKHKKRENPKKAVKKQNTPYKLRIYGVYEV